MDSKYRYVIGRLMMQVREEQKLREDIISGDDPTWRLIAPTEKEIDDKIEELTFGVTCFQ